MPYFRKLESGRWQATVRTLDGRRISRTDPLRKVVAAWAKDAETQIAQGRWKDPRKTHITVGQWWELYSYAKRVETETARADESSWRLHIQPTFEHVQLADLKPVDVEIWVVERINAGVGPSAIRRALNLLKAILESAVDNNHLPSNVARKVRHPQEAEPVIDWFTLDEVDAIVAEMRARQWYEMAAMTLVMVWAGLRWGEAAALNVEDFDFTASTIDISHTLTQNGKDKPYPKNDASVDLVSCPGHVLDAVRDVLGDKTRGRVFTTRRQSKDLSGANWRRDWDDVLAAAGVRRRHPHICRHTCASWLVQAGVPLYNVSKQLRHASIQTTQRYAHLAPEVHDPVRTAWEKMTHPRRMNILDQGKNIA